MASVEQHELWASGCALLLDCDDDAIPIGGWRIVLIAGDAAAVEIVEAFQLRRRVDAGGKISQSQDPAAAAIGGQHAEMAVVQKLECDAGGNIGCADQAIYANRFALAFDDDEVEFQGGEGGS